MTSLVPISPTSPLDPMDLLAAHDFSHFAVASGLLADNDGFLTYDNLFWPRARRPRPTSMGPADSWTFMDSCSTSAARTCPRARSLICSTLARPNNTFQLRRLRCRRGDICNLGELCRGRRHGKPAGALDWAMLLFGFAGLGFAGYRKSRKAAAIVA